VPSSGFKTSTFLWYVTPSDWVEIYRCLENIAAFITSLAIMFQKRLFNKLGVSDWVNE
jgi:hypothetical protein